MSAPAAPAGSSKQLDHPHLSALNNPSSATRSKKDDQPKKPGIVWDEENLSENERIKAELNPVKINEPKTPYHGPLPDNDMELKPLALDQRLDGSSPGTNVDGRRSSSGMEEDLLRSGYTSDSSFGRGSLTGELVGDEAEEAHRRKFEASRKAHYNMREAMKARHMVEEDEEEEEERRATCG